MDNLTHSLCGWLLSRAGLDRLGAWVSPVMIIGANLPDAEWFLDPFATRAEYLLHHRGFSHSLLGIAALGVGLAVAVWLVGRLLKNKIHQPPPLLPALLVSIIAVASHLLLDWFNTYGVRPLAPFSERRFYGDMAYIVDPWMWLILGGAVFCGSRRSRLLRNVFLFLAACTTAIMIQAARQGIVPAPSVGVYIVLLAIVVTLRITVFSSQPQITPARIGLLVWTVYIAGLFLASRTSVSRAYEALKASDGEPPPGLRLSANPVPAVPWRFEVIAYTEKSAEQISVDLIGGTAERHKQINPRLDHPGLQTVKDTPEYAAWREFARFPTVRERSAALVLGDLRYRLFDRPEQRDAIVWPELTVPLTNSNLMPRVSKADDAKDEH